MSVNFLKAIWNDVKRGESIDSYLVIAAAFILVLLQLFQVPIDYLIAPITLAVLGLLAISNLGTRHKIEELLKRTNQNTGFVFSEEFPRELNDEFETARDTIMIGITFSRTIRTHYTIMEQKLKKGHSIKFLLVHPGTSSAAITAARTYRPTSATEKDQEILATLRTLQELKKIAPKKLEIRTIDNPLTYGVRAINPHTENGALYIEHYAYKTQDSMPRLILRTSDGYWYKHFIQEIQTLWTDGKEWNSSM